jgi:predicted metal-binding protein
MKTQHTLFICTTCASTWQDGKRIGKSGGEALLEQISTLAKNWELQDNFHIQEVSCMSACSRACAVSFTAAGKYTYLFGDLPANTSESATAVLECASQYYAKPDGLLPWSERPEPLKKGIVARIPPLPNYPVTPPSGQ